MCAGVQTLAARSASARGGRGVRRCFTWVTHPYAQTAVAPRRDGMKITVRLVSGENFPVEVELSETTVDLKNKIAGVRGAGFEAELQKLVHAGKVRRERGRPGAHHQPSRPCTRPPPSPVLWQVMKDEQSLGDQGVKEGGFVVCMVSKVKVSTRATTTTTIVCNGGG